MFWKIVEHCTLRKCEQCQSKTPCIKKYIARYTPDTFPIEQRILLKTHSDKSNHVRGYACIQHPKRNRAHGVNLS